MKSLPFLIFMYFSEWVIVYSYAKNIYEKKHKYSAAVSLGFYIVLMVLYGYVINTEFVNVILTAVCNILCIRLCFKSSLKSSIFHGITLLIIQCISEAVSIYLIAYITKTPNDFYTENDVIFVTDVILSKIGYFMLSRILAKISNKESSAKSWGKWILLSVLPLSSIFLLTTFRLLTNGLAFSKSYTNILIIAMIFLLFANIAVYLIYEQSEKANQKLIELEMMNQKNDIDLQYLDLLEKKNEQMQIMAHDYKNNLLDIKAMFCSDKTEEYIDNMLGEISGFSQIGKTKNKLLDVILSKYSDICSTKKIKFKTDIMNDNLSFLTGNDTSALFNNLLDNSVEAAEKSKERFIELQITNSINSYHKITLTNSCDTMPDIKDGKLITIKKDKETHGFGTKSIQKIIDKYNGEIKWEYNKENNKFKVVILIPREQ